MEKQLTKSYNRIESYLDFVHYCLRRLGGGTINIEITDEQIQDRVSDALQFYREFHLESTILTHWVYRITQYDMDRGYLEMPPDIIDVVDVKTHNTNTEGTDLSGLDNVEYQFWQSFWGINGSYAIGMPVNTGMIYYEMSMMELNTIQKVLNAIVQFSWRPRSNQLFLFNQMKLDNRIMISAYEMVDPETNDKIWDSLFLKEYATTLLGLQWAINLGKFGNIPTAGGITLDAQSLYQRYAEDKLKLESEFRDKWEEPPMGGFY